MRAGLGLAALAAAAMLGCTTMSDDNPPRATAGLHPTKGNKTEGEVTFEQLDGKVRVTAQVIGLKPNQEHGFHIHGVGDCSSGDGMSAKGHAGDLPNLKADAKGRAHLQVELDTITVTTGPASIVGRAVIIHALPDDYHSQPTGNAGARMACGVIRAG